MPDFQYIARELSGQQVGGVLSASNEQDALATLSARQLFPVRIELADEARAKQAKAERRVAAKHLSIFYSQLADLLRSGVPLLRSLELLERQTTHQGLQGVIGDVREQVADGTRLNAAMKQHPRSFNDLVVSMVRAGEEGGFLEDVLKRIATFTDHQEELKSRVIGAMVYPMFLMGFGTVIVWVLLVWFVPKFEPIFQRMAEREGLPWATTTLLSFSGTLQSYWHVTAAAVFGAIIGTHRYLSTEQGRYQYDKFRLKCIGWRRVTRSLALSRFFFSATFYLHKSQNSEQNL